MSEQLNFDQIIRNTNEGHLSCALLLDTSGSMNGAAIRNLNSAIKQFKQDVCSDPDARNRVDVALVTFNSEVKVINDFCPVTEMQTPELYADGLTDMAAGIQVALDLVKRRTRMYQKMGTPCHKPWIFMITDGKSTSLQSEMTEAANRIQAEERKGANGHINFWSIGVGNYDALELYALSLKKRVVELSNMDFSGLFEFLSESVIEISHSQVGEQVEFGPLPDNARELGGERY